MIEQDKKKQREVEFIQQYTLSKEDFRKMVLEKMERAKVYSKPLESARLLKSDCRPQSVNR